MTSMPLPQVAGFDAPIRGGFWAPTDTARRSFLRPRQPFPFGMFSSGLTFSSDEPTIFAEALSGP